MVEPTISYVCVCGQADNAGDCKSRWNFAWAAWLVKARFFKKVVLGFFLVGHTHEDIDQMFSRFSIALYGKRTFCTCVLARMRDCTIHGFGRD
jgi:hypothetical protein